MFVVELFINSTKSKKKITSQKYCIIFVYFLYHFAVLWCVRMCVSVCVIAIINLCQIYLIHLSVGIVILSFLKGNFSELEINSLNI